MAYATVQDLLDAFGERELIQLTTPDGADLAVVDADRAQAALDVASGLMDAVLRRRYRVPVPVSPELRACCCDIARHRLSLTGGVKPTDQVDAARKAAFAWLDRIGEGRATLDGAVPAGPLSGARVQDRSPVLRARGSLH